jgi:outer membrane protein assembly factor BamD
MIDRPGVDNLHRGMVKLSPRSPAARGLLLALALLILPGCVLFHRRDDDASILNPGDQPDKILYEKAAHEVDVGHYDVGRLTLQTLINTYPDSEYLAKAKLTIADSYYAEGGVAGLTQAEAEYKDFITFFPTAPEAPEAQYRAGMAHFRLMAKADRDRTEAKLAEAEFKEFLLKYPDSQTMPRVKARLRQVQEVLAQGDYRIARFYYSKGAMRAAYSRFQEIADRYPNFSQGDSALWYVGQSLEHLRKPQEAVNYYSRVITEHPLSPLVPDAKGRLSALHQPIPHPTKAMLARAEADATPRPGKDLFQKLGSFLSSAPDTSTTRRGPVRLGKPTPEEIEVARGSQGTPSSASIVAQPVGEEALKTGQPVTPTSGGNSSTSATASLSQDANGDSKQGDSAASQNGEKSNSSPAKNKKARRGLLKRILKPF